MVVPKESSCVVAVVDLIVVVKCLSVWCMGTRVQGAIFIAAPSNFYTICISILSRGTFFVFAIKIIFLKKIIKKRYF